MNRCVGDLRELITKHLIPSIIHWCGCILRVAECTIVMLRGSPLYHLWNLVYIVLFDPQLTDADTI